MQGEYNEVRRDRRLFKLTTLTVVFALTPLTILAGVYLLNDRNYYLVSLLIVCYIMALFFMMFERKKPRAREVIVVAVLTAIGVAGRAAFFMLPQFKPMIAVIVVSGACLGAEAGFLIGAMTGFVSNFMFGQGPWTPWQMFALGMTGFFAGLLFEKRLAAWTPGRRRAILCAYGIPATFFLYGGVVDIWTAMALTPAEVTAQALLTVYTLAVPFNAIHSASTAIFLLLIGNPMIEKLERAKLKFGLLSQARDFDQDFDQE
jgi:energy-coupling factor transport system substrate-specific component